MMSSDGEPTNGAVAAGEGVALGVDDATMAAPMANRFERYVATDKCSVSFSALGNTISSPMSLSENCEYVSVPYPYGTQPVYP